ncbi:hypothetical protein [Microlunatus sp. Y2014]|uniref:hypothetical protein n=1 Tax=Microlunatus sp. Y2014 TaxID=3418488 RepID=UPI003DA73C0C
MTPPLDPADTSLAAHPRLYLPGSRPTVTTDTSRRIAARVQELADAFLVAGDRDEVPATHNGHLIRARRMHRRIVTLLAQWRVSGDRRYRDAVLDHVAAMGRWEYWSWITWRRNDPRPEAIFDLSYGENSTTLALVHDQLYDDLTDAERHLIIVQARDRALRSFLAVVERGEAWWLGKDDSNWNTVCAGGAGVLALSLHEDLAEARAALPIVEESITPFMTSLERTDGGWPEGIGYWAYGMTWAFTYLRSHERATGRPHPLLRAEATAATIEFPLDFWPYGQPCSFGDSNHFSLSPLHLHVAAELGCNAAVDAVRTLVRDGAFETEYESRPLAAEALLLGAGEDDSAAGAGNAADPVRSYPGLGWVRLADRWPEPRLYLAIRGGSSGVPHGHRDLLSFHAVVDGEQLIENLTPHEYLDTTFGPRREELFEMAPVSKNVPLINGVGIVNGVHVVPQLVDVDGFPGVLLDATEAMGVARGDEPLADRCTRLFVHFGDRAALVLDQFDLAHDGRVETRLHSPAEVVVDGHRADISRGEAQLTVAHAAASDAPGLDDFTLVASPTTPTTPGEEATLLRWHGPHALGRRFVTATLLARGRVDAGVALDLAEDGTVRVELYVGDWRHRFDPATARG